MKREKCHENDQRFVQNYSRNYANLIEFFSHQPITTSTTSWWCNKYIWIGWFEPWIIGSFGGNFYWVIHCKKEKKMFKSSHDICRVSNSDQICYKSHTRDARAIFSIPHITIGKLHWNKIDTIRGRKLAIQLEIDDEWQIEKKNH